MEVRGERKWWYVGEMGGSGGTERCIVKQYPLVLAEVNAWQQL